MNEWNEWNGMEWISSGSFAMEPSLSHFRTMSSTPTRFAMAGLSMTGKRSDYTIL